MRAKFAAIRCWRVGNDGTRQIGWLIGQRPTRGQGGWKYFWSNFPPTADLAVLAEYTHRRYGSSSSTKKPKVNSAGNYPGRHGFHRHAVLVMLFYSFLVWLEWRQRQQQPSRGRPRAAFSPSTGSTAMLAPGHSSPGRRMAA